MLFVHTGSSRIHLCSSHVSVKSLLREVSYLHVLIGVFFLLWDQFLIEVWSLWFVISYNLVIFNTGGRTLALSSSSTVLTPYGYPLIGLAILALCRQLGQCWCTLLPLIWHLLLWWRALVPNKGNHSIIHTLVVQSLIFFNMMILSPSQTSKMWHLMPDMIGHFSFHSLLFLWNNWVTSGSDRLGLNKKSSYDHAPPQSLSQD